MQTIDSPNSVAGHIHHILAAGYHGIIRYVSPSTARYPTKQLSQSESVLIHSVPGMHIGLCYEFEPATDKYADQVAYFTVDQADRDSTRALQALSDLNVPQSIPVFFGADFDPKPGDIDGSLEPYFARLATSFESVQRKIGVYGSGLTCSKLKAAGVARYTWLAMARSWADYAVWKPSADIIQISEQAVAGLTVDTNYVVSEPVLW